MSTSQKSQGETVIGQVTEALPNTTFRVEYVVGEGDNTETKEVIAYLAGRMRRFRIRVLPGDKVEVLLDGFENTKGRIIKRH